MLKFVKFFFQVPSVNQFLLKKKDYFFQYKDAVEMIMLKYNDSLTSTVPDLRRLFTPHVNRIRWIKLKISGVFS